MMNTKFKHHVEQRALSSENTHLYILVQWNPMSYERSAILLFQTNHACYRRKIELHLRQEMEIYFHAIVLCLEFSVLGKYLFSQKKFINCC